MNELLYIDMQEYINEHHSLEEMNELYERFEKEIKVLKAKGDTLSDDEMMTLSVLELKAFQLVREIDSVEN